MWAPGLSRCDTIRCYPSVCTSARGPTRRPRRVPCLRATSAPVPTAAIPSEVDTKAGRVQFKLLESEHVKETADLLAKSFSDAIKQPRYYKYFTRQIAMYLEDHIRSEMPCVVFVGLLQPGSTSDDESTTQPGSQSPPLDVHKPASVTGDETSTDESTNQMNESSAGGADDGEIVSKPVVVATAELSFASRTRSRQVLLNSPNDSTYLCNMAVKDEFQNMRIGSRLLDVMETYVRSRKADDTIYLHLRLKDAPAGRLYRSKGYEEYGTDWPVIGWLGLDRKHLMQKCL